MSNINITSITRSLPVGHSVSAFDGMGVWIGGERFALCFEANVDLVAELAQRASQCTTPAGDRSPEPADPAPLTVTGRHRGPRLCGPYRRRLS